MHIAGVRVADALDLDALPRGQTTRLGIDLAHDGLGRPIRLPVVVARGRHPGPVVGLTAAVHGDELNGVPMLHGLLARLDPTRLRGTVVAVIAVNVPGVLRHERVFADGRDLNHQFPGVADGNAGQVFAHRLLDRIVRHFDHLIDLHTASAGRVNSLYVRADMTDPVAAQMAVRMRPQIIVHNPPNDATLRGAVFAHGIHAITVEIGNPGRYQRDLITRTRVGVRAFLADLGMMPRRPVATGAPPLFCSSSGWMYTDTGGLLEVLPKVAERVEAGQVIARLTSVYGDPVREYTAPHDAVVVGRSVNPIAETGARIAHLGVVHPDQPPGAPYHWNTGEESA